MQVQLPSICNCHCGIKPGGVWTGEVKASEAARCENSPLTSPSGADVEEADFPSHGWRQIVCLLFFCQCTHTPPPRSNSVDMCSPCTETSFCLLYWKEGAVYAGMAMGEFYFHQRGQPLSKSLLLPSSLSAIHHRWWMGNREAIAFSFTALYHFW